MLLLDIEVNHLNTALDLDYIPVHIELRVDGNNILPIEINPLRFAGLCLNELNFHVTNRHPLGFYFSNTVPGYENMWKGKENEIYCFPILEKDKHSKENSLEKSLIKNIYSNILKLKPVKNPNLDIQTFVFSKTNDESELKNILELKIQCRFNSRG